MISLALPTRASVEGHTPALAPGATTLKEFFVFLKPVGLDTGPAFGAGIGPATSTRDYSTNGLLSVQFPQGYDPVLPGFHSDKMISRAGRQTRHCFSPNQFHWLHSRPRSSNRGVGVRAESREEGSDMKPPMMVSIA